jgi:aminoglycoside phosphotransferase (APT) family kinase protein
MTEMLNSHKHSIMFTHGDFRPANIIVKDGHIAGTIDWELAGWYPKHWEFVKAFFIWYWQMIGGSDEGRISRSTITLA